jgi:FMN phosphatase YigB (HAD superfamily)
VKIRQVSVWCEVQGNEEYFMIKTILWDVDGTLLDFAKSERYGLFACLDAIGFHDYDDEMLARYAKINRGYWEALERGELTKQEVLVGRFRTFFAQEGIACPDVEAFNDSYQESLGSHFFENEDSLKLCRKLQGRVNQYVVTNGTVTAQRNKLQYSGLGACMEGVFISDEIGIEKPQIGFFTQAFASIEAQLGEPLWMADRRGFPYKRYERRQCGRYPLLLVQSKGIGE